MQKINKIIDNIYWVGVVDYDLKVFDIIMETEYGSTYNSYLVVGSEKTALIDTAKAKFKDEYLNRIKEIIDIKNIDYLILNHTEPDHSGSVKYIVEENPNIEIFATIPALMNLKEIINMPFKGNKVTKGMSLSLGDKTLEFFLQPHLHWPDTMFTYVKEDNFLFTCDFLGAHFATDNILAKNLKNRDTYLRTVKEYFEAIMHPFLPHIRKGINKIKELNPDYVAVSHGVTLDSSLLKEVVALYDELSIPIKKPDKPLVLIPYASAYGYTEKMANIIKETIEDELDNEVYIELYDLIFTDVKEIIKKVPICDALLIGSSTIVRDTVKIVWDLLAGLDFEMTKGKLASAFGSYGWSGEAVDNILQREQQLKFKTVEGLKIKFNPSESQIEEIKEYGRNFSKLLNKKG
ncbi:FprA family A-type flavoprotein [Mycoplasmatota bacterium WC30]